jgi:hypothetical protein
VETNLSRFLIVLSLLALSLDAHSQIPRYNLVAENDSLVAPNILEFDVNLTWINSDSVSIFEFSGNKLAFEVNPDIGSNGGIVTMHNVGSDLPTNLQPRNPSVFTNRIPWVLGWAVNTFPGAGSGLLLSGDTPVKIVRVRLKTTAISFPQVPLNLIWRNPDALSIVTKIFAYVGTTNTDITTPSTHLNSLSNFQFPIRSTLNIKVALEGLYRNVLNKHIMRDTVTILLRHTVFPYGVLDSIKSLVDSATLNTQSIFGSIPQGNYYIVVRHRNSIETWSKPGGEQLYPGVNYTYDFTSSQSQAYGNNLKLIGTKWCIYTGDVTQSGFIDALDMMNVDNDIFVFRTGYVPTDLNGDNFVDIDDLGMIDNNVRRWIGVERPWTMEAIMTEKVNYNP